jgi:hypothetical protein
MDTKSTEDTIGRSGPRENPVCVSDDRNRDVIVLLVLSMMIFGVAAISLYRFGVGNPDTSIQVLLLVPLGLVFLAFTGFAYLKARRVEFYDSFVRVVSRNGAVDVPYSQVVLELKQVRGRTGISELGRLSVGERSRLSISDVKIQSLETTLFKWLPTKLSEHPPSGSS